MSKTFRVSLPKLIKNGHLLDHGSNINTCLKEDFDIKSRVGIEVIDSITLEMTIEDETEAMLFKLKHSNVIDLD